MLLPSDWLGRSALFRLLIAPGVFDACVQQKGAPVAVSPASSSDSDSSEDEPQAKVQKAPLKRVAEGGAKQKAQRKIRGKAPPTDSSEDTSSDDESNARTVRKSPVESSAAAGM